MKTIQLTEKETQVTLVALEELIKIKNGQFPSAEAMFIHFSNQQLNEKDILASGHTCAAALTAIEKLSGTPIATFMNPQPSQTGPDDAR